MKLQRTKMTARSCPPPRGQVQTGDSNEVILTTGHRCQLNVSTCSKTYQTPAISSPLSHQALASVTPATLSTVISYGLPISVSVTHHYTKLGLHNYTRVSSLRCYHVSSYSNTNYLIGTSGVSFVCSLNRNCTSCLSENVV